jgi:hypothetical protein
MLLRVLCCAIALGTAACSFDPSGTGDVRSSRSRRDSANARSDSDEEAARIAADRLGTGRKDAGADAAIGVGEEVGEEEAAGSSGEDARGTRGPSTAAAARTGESGAQTAAAGSVAAAGGGGASGASSTLAAEGGGPDVSPDEVDAGEDDSDAGTEPSGPNPDPNASGGAGAGGAAGERSAAGTGGSAGEHSVAGSGGKAGTAAEAEAGAGGRASAGSSGSSGDGAGGDREILLSLLDVVVGVLQSDADADAGDLLSVLANATSADPDLLERVLVFVHGSQDCERRDSDPCDRVCEVVAGRCEECSDDEDCRAALQTACGSDATQCR